MEKNDLTNKQKYQKIQTKLQAIDRTLKNINTKPGLSQDVIELFTELQQKSQVLVNNVNTTWQAVAERQQADQIDGSFDTLFDSISNLLDEVNDLYKESDSESALVKNAKATFKIEKKDYVEARDHHKIQAYISLIILLVLCISSGIFIWHSFIEFKDNFDDIKSLIETVKILETNTDFLTKIVFIKTILKITGRLSIVGILVWLIVFVGKLHSKHNKQYISYQDRLSGLSAAELIITAGRTATREKVLLEMTDSYLSLKHNAFNEQYDNNVSAGGFESQISKFDQIYKKLSSMFKSI